MIITAIEPFKRGKGRVAIYLNGEFAFVLYKGELAKYGIELDKNLSCEQYTQIVNETLALRAKKRGMNLLMAMDRTEKDVRGKLADSGYPVEAIDIAIDYLKSFSYIDDYRYASDYINCKRNSMSFKQIKHKLSEKGITQDILENAFENINEGENTELELIKKLIVKRVGERAGNLDYSEKQKLFSYLYNKGFSISDIERSYNCLT